MKKWPYLVFALSITDMYAGSEKLTKEQEALINQSIRNRSVQFLENKGQIADMKGRPAPYVLFKTEAPGIDLYITEKGLTYMYFEMDETEEKEGKKEEKQLIADNRERDERAAMKWSRIDMELEKAVIKKENVIVEGRSTFFNNYYLSHCPDGVLNVHSYSKITIKDLYPGIDWVFYNSNDKGFKYDFVVHQGANPNQIKIIYRSKNKLQTDRYGNIKIKSPYGTLTENSPVSYFAGSKEMVPTKFVTTKTTLCNPSGTDEGHETHISFDLNVPTNKSEKLVIDPQVVWGTLFGGNGFDGPRSIDCDLNGNIFIGGYQTDGGFPLLNAFDGTYGGGAMGDAFISKFTNSGVLLFSTYYGGAGSDWGNSVAVDLTGNVYLAGHTESNTSISSLGHQNVYGGARDAFLVKFTTLGTRIWATYYGGTDADEGRTVTVDASNNIYLAGATKSLMAIASGGIQNIQGGSNDGFLAKFNSAGTLLWATYYGSTGWDEATAVTTDNITNDVYFTGRAATAVLSLGGYQNVYGGGPGDAFLVKLSPAGALIWATYYGGIGYEHGWGLALDKNTQDIYLSGQTSSAVGIAVGGYDMIYGGAPNDAFLAKFNPAGGLIWATYCGGSADETSNGFGMNDNLAIDNCSNVYLSFGTFSTNISIFNPGCGSWVDASYGGGSIWGDIFVIKLTAVGIPVWSTYIGGAYDDFGHALAVDGNNNLFLTGEYQNPFGLAAIPSVNPGGGAYFDNTVNGKHDGVIFKFTPEVAAFTKSQTNVTGCGCNGSATINISCGNPSYSYVWSNGNSTLNSNSASNTLSYLCPGTYTVTCYLNCDTFQTAYTITGNSGGTAPTVSITTTKIDCYGGTATATAIGNGGTPNYTYNWSAGIPGSGFEVTGLSAGTYTLTITDSNGCTSTSTVTISSPSPLFGQFTKGTANCAGCGCKEWIMVNATGGTSPYSYSWPDGYVNRYKNQICPGIYSVNIKDKNGCSVNVNLTTP